MKNLKISFIGAGNMANSIIQGLLADGYEAKNIWATNTNLDKLNKLKNLNINISTDNCLAVSNADIIVLAVKPQILKKVAIEIANLIRKKKPLVISIAAAINLKTLENYLQDTSIALIRSMPNTPALLKCGATGLFANSSCSQEQKKITESIFNSIGVIVWVNSDEEIDSIAALSGSGPAYFFLLIEALQNAGAKLGLSKETASLLSRQTALGAARMATESGNVAVEQLRQNVTSRGGTTQAAIEILEKGQFSELIEKAMQTAKQRAGDLADEFQKQE
ncbi:MAG: pyrroline-5-carboxylate reductase [Pseudomonadota bacterium]